MRDDHHTVGYESRRGHDGVGRGSSDVVESGGGDVSADLDEHIERLASRALRQPADRDRATSAQIIADMAARRSREAADPAQARIASLTPRERDVVRLVAEGLSNKAIAERMRISDNTVRHHLTSIFSKLDIADRLSLVVYTYHHKIS